MNSAHYQFHQFDCVESTQTTLKQICNEQPGKLHCVSANRQSSGRGRHKNSWESPLGGLWCSFNRLSDSPPEPFLGLLLALAVCQSLRQSLAAQQAQCIKIKWPNDLQLSGRKFGGILTEAQFQSSKTEYFFGLGLNLDFPASDLGELPSGINPTTFFTDFGHSPSPQEAKLDILARFEKLISLDQSNRTNSIKLISRDMSTIGKKIRWQDELQEAQEGEAIALHTDGALQVKDSQGILKLLHAGEVHHLRTR